MSSLEQMSRDELEERVETLEDDLAELRKKVEQQPTRTTFNHILSNLMNINLENYTADPGQLIGPSQEFGNQIQSMDQRITLVEEIAEEEQSLSNDPSVTNWQSIVEMAQNLSGDRDHTLPNGRVKLYGKQVKSAVGCSERHALNLIEQYGEEKRGVDWQEYKRHTTSRKTKSQDIQRKALKVDLNIWGEGDE